MVVVVNLDSIVILLIRRPIHLLANALSISRMKCVPLETSNFFPVSTLRRVVNLNLLMRVMSLLPILLI